MPLQALFVKKCKFFCYLLTNAATQREKIILKR